MKVSEEVEEEVKAENNDENEAPTEKIDYAKKWFIACIVLFVILIILVIALQIFKTGDLWPDAPMTGK